MTMRRIWLLLSFVAFVAAGIFDWRVYLQWTRARILGAQDRSGLSRFPGLAASAFREGSPSDRIGRAAATAAPFGARGTGKERAALQALAPSAAPIDPKQLIALDPQLRARAMDLTRKVTPYTYGLLFRMLQLPSDQQAQLTDILTQMEEGKMRIAAIAADQGLTADDPAIKAIQAQQSQVIHAQLEDLLGANGMAELQQYWNAGPDLWMVNDIAGLLPPNALSVAQQSQLLYTLANSSQKLPSGVAIVQTVNVDQAVAEASSFLPAQDLVTLSAFLQLQEAYRQMHALASSR